MMYTYRVTIPLALFLTFLQGCWAEDVQKFQIGLSQDDTGHSHGSDHKIAAAHKGLKPPKVLDAGCQANILTLDLTHDQNELMQNVETARTGLQILWSGQYHVYSNIHFTPDSDCPNQEAWEHAVLRSTSLGSHGGEVLEVIHHDVCNGAIINNGTSRIDAIVDLQAGDIIQVQVSASAQIEFKTTVSYFGLYLKRRV